MFQRYRFVIILAIIFFALLAAVFWFAKRADADEPAYHVHAAFSLYRDNTLVDFSDDQYMHVAPCGDTDALELTKEEEQIKKGHLHDNVDDVVHVHKKNSRWKDLFTNMGYDLNGDVVVYINGERVFNALNKKMGAYDRALFLIGDASDTQAKIDAVPSVDHVKEVEAAGESC